MKEEKKNKQLLSRDAELLLKSYRVDSRLDKEEAWGRLMEKVEEREQKPVRRISWYLTAAASVAAVAAVLVAFWFFTATENISASGGETFAFRLPDNSRVILHDGSSLSYRKHFWNRNVRLTGEAYFEVEKGEGFQVKTPLGEVEVLGTRFLVNEAGHRFTVQCYEGKVKTSYQQGSWLLESGTRFSGIPEKAEKVTLKAPAEYPGFAKFSGNFKDAPLKEVVHEMERFFGVDIQLKPAADRYFTGAIQTGSLENALQIVLEPLQLEYAFDNKYRIIIY